MLQRKWYWVLATLVVVSIGSFVFLRPRIQGGTATVDKVVTPTLTQRNTVETVSNPETQRQQPADTASMSSVTETVETPFQDAPDAPETQAVLSEHDEHSDRTATPADESEQLQYGDYTDEEIIQLQEWGEDLRDRLFAEYADLRELADMTPEEIAKKYPTDEDRRRLAERAQRFMAEFLEEVSAYLVSLPQPIRQKAFEELHRDVTKSWGREGADNIMKQLSEMISEAAP